MENQIEIKNLTKSFGSHVVLKDVNLNIPSPKIFGIIGESGSGKTTLLKTIIGFWHFDNGQIMYEGRNLEKDRNFIKQIVGFATQDNCVYPKLTVKENLEYFGSLSNVPSGTLKGNIEKVIRFVNLQDSTNKLAENLSGGMQRRLDIACALVHNPKILILDEPTEDLDPLLRRDILNLIRKINLNETTVIITSHLLHEAEQLCDNIAILHQGCVLKYGSPEHLKDSYTKDEEIHLITKNKNYDKLIKLLKNKQKVSNIEKLGRKIVIYTKEAEPILSLLLSELKKEKDRIIQIDVRRPSLGEVFENLIKKSDGVKKGEQASNNNQEKL